MTSTTTYTLHTMRALRVARGMTQADLARAVRMRQPQISQLETGRIKVSMEVCHRIALVLRVPVSALLVSMSLADLVCA